LEAILLPDLVARCRAADRKAQEHIFRTYYSDFLKICLRYAHDQPAAEAMLSDAFFKIFTKIDSYNGSGPFEAWMRRIVVNTCLTHCRNSGGSTDAPLPDADHSIHTGQSLQSSNEALSRLGIQELTRLIQSLPPMSRTVFNLFVFDGYSHKEIAGHLGITEGTSHWHVSSARQWLKAKLLKAQPNG
jgi:RNA polymerase sigma-70 factor (ECF subfamily)